VRSSTRRAWVTSVRDAVHLLGQAGVAGEGERQRERGRNSRLVQVRLDRLLAAIGQRVAGAPRRGDVADDAVATRALDPRPVVALPHDLEARQPGRNVVNEVGGEDLASHDLVEPAGDLLVHGDPRGGLQDVVGVFVADGAPVVRGEPGFEPKGNGPASDNGRANHVGGPESGTAARR
jgi:hypothetical protein